MTTPVIVDPWENIIFNEGSVNNQIDGNLISIFLNLEFQNEYGDTIFIPNLVFHKMYNQILEKIQKDNFTNQDFHRLYLSIDNFISNLVFLFRKIGPKLNGQRDDKFDKVMNTLDLVFSSFGLEFYRGGGFYYKYAETLYTVYLSCLRRIETITRIRVHKGVPHHMLSLIYYKSDRVMRMFGQIGSTLIEDRLTGISNTPADSFLDIIEGEQISFFEEQYNIIVNNSVINLLNINKPIPTLKVLIEYLKSNMSDFPDYALMFLTIKYKFMRKYLYEELSYEDIFSSVLRLELLNFFTAFIETFLRKVLQQPPTQLLFKLIDKFTDNAFSFALKLSTNQQKIPSYYSFMETHSKDDPDFYQEFCDYILNLTTAESTDPSYIDISSDDKLKIFQSSMIIMQTRNSFHHELNIILNQRSVRTGIPQTISYISEITKYNEIFEFHRFYTCLILIYAYNIF